MTPITLLGTTAPLKIMSKGNIIFPAKFALIIVPVLCFLMMTLFFGLASYTKQVGSPLLGIILSINVYSILIFIFINLLFAMVPDRRVSVNYTKIGINLILNLPSYICVGIFVYIANFILFYLG